MTSLPCGYLMFFLVQAEGRLPPSATDMEMKARLVKMEVKMEVEMTASSAKHQDE